MLIKNARIVLKDCVFVGDLRTEKDRITEISEAINPNSQEVVYNADNNILMPGFIDTHTHGAVGEEYFNSDGDLNKITEFEAANGVTAVAATIYSLPIEHVELCSKNILKYIKNGSKGAKIIGVHAEGPFLNPARKGGMNLQNIKNGSMDYFERMYSAYEGYLKIITVAPECEGNTEVIKEAVKRGVKVSAGHTQASYDEMKKAIDIGVTRMTHTFNACAGLVHREPGVLGAALTDERVNCEVICDFAHLHPAAVELIYKAKGSHKFTAISDSEWCAGMPDGMEFEVDGRMTKVSGGVAFLEDGTICGSAGTLYNGFKNLYSLNIPLWEIAEMVSQNPAKAMGLDNECGSIEVGKKADIVIIDSDLRIDKTFADGNLVYEK